MINLFPWRNALRNQQIKKLSICAGLFILIFASLMFSMAYHAKQRTLEQSVRNQQLEREIDRLKVAFHTAKLHQPKLHAIRTQQVSDEAPQEIPLQSEIIQINYAKASDLALILKDKTNALLSEQGILTVDSRTNVIWLQDTASRIQNIKSLLKHFDVPNKQVLIEARLVNMSKECANDLGVRFGLLHASNNDNLPNDRINLDLSAMPLDATPASIGLAFATLSEHVLLDIELSALESEGKAEIIASPRLITTNQEAAVIESGEDIPYQEYTASGATSVAFKKAVLSLKVIPQITADGQLMMALSINQDSDSGRRVQGVPIILTKSIETNVVVKNGQTIVLGGIYKQDKNNSIARVPFLGDLPVIGYLFRRKQVKIRNEELLIFITPRIIGSKK